MRSASMCLGLAILAATTAATPTQCEQSAAQQKLQAAYGHLVVEYTTQPGDNPYSLATRFYGRGYWEFKIRKPNEKLLTAYGLFPVGTKILVPPDENGRPVDVNRAPRQTY